MSRRREILGAAWRAIREAIGLDEAGLVVGLVLLVSGLWHAFGWLALLAPAAVLLWIFLPSRHPFVARQPDMSAKPAAPARRKA